MMKRFCLVFIVILLLSSCRLLPNETEDTDKVGAVVPVIASKDERGIVYDNLYLQHRLPVPDGYIFSLNIVGQEPILADENGVLHVYYYNRESSVVVERYDAELNPIGSEKTDFQKGTHPDGFLLTEEGYLYFRCYGDVKDMVFYRNAGGNAEEVCTPASLLGLENRDGSAWGMNRVYCQNGIIAVIDNDEILLIRPDTWSCTLITPEFEPAQLGADANGFWVLDAEGNAYRLSPDGKTEAADIPLPMNIENDINGMSFGQATVKTYTQGGFYFGGGYDYYYLNTAALYGMNDGDSTAELLMNLSVSGLSSGAFQLLGILSPDCLLAAVQQPLQQDYEPGMQPIVLTRDSASEKRIPVTLATNETQLRDVLYDAVNLFNAENNTYRVVIANYAADGSIVSDEKLLMDILTGARYDLLVCSPLYNTAEKLEKQKALLPLNDAAEKAGLLPIVAAALSDGNGGLYHIPMSMAMSVLFTDRETAAAIQTIQSLSELQASLPEGIRVFAQLGGQSLFRHLLCASMNFFADESTGICSFDSGEFAALLELCSALPPDHRYGLLPAASQTNYSRAVCEAIRNGDALAVECLYRGTYRFQSLYDYVPMKHLFADRELVITGLPTIDGYGGVQIHSCADVMLMKDSVSSDGALAFLEFLLSDRVQTAASLNTNSLPVTSSGFDAMCIQLTSYYWYCFDSGEVLRTTDETPRRNAVSYRFTEKDASVLGALFYNPSAAASRSDRDLEAIALEEASEFFAGKQSASSAASAVQTRASICISEKR